MKNKEKMLFLFLGCLFLSGCRSTPEIPPVVNRSEGGIQNSVIEPEKEGELKEISAPAVWNETIDKGEGRVLIQAENTEVVVPEVQNTPVVEVEAMDFDTALLERMVAFFAGNSKIYKRPQMTKTELEYYRDKIENREGIYGNPQESAWISMELSNINELIEEAPETVKKEYIRLEFTCAQTSEYRYVRAGEKEEETEKKDHFYAVAEDTGAQIEAGRKEYDSGENFFYYRNGDYLDSEYLESVKLDIETLKEKANLDPEWFSSYEAFAGNLEQRLKENTLDQEKIKHAADRILKDLGITELSAVGVRPCVWSEKSLQWDKMEIDWETAKDALVIEYARTSGGLSSKLPDSAAFYYYEDGLPEKTYAPAFLPESLIMVFTENGLQIFEWDHMAKMVRVIADNTKLLPFEEIKERFAQHVFYGAASADANMESSIKMKEKYVVTEVRLMSFYTEAYGQPENAWMVPAWLFVYDHYIDTGGSERYLGSNICTLIHAVDGGYIELMGS